MQKILYSGVTNAKKPHPLEIDGMTQKNDEMEVIKLVHQNMELNKGILIINFSNNSEAEEFMEELTDLDERGLLSDKIITQNVCYGLGSIFNDN